MLDVTFSFTILHRKPLYALGNRASLADLGIIPEAYGGRTETGLERVHLDSHTEGSAR